MMEELYLEKIDVFNEVLELTQNLEFKNDEHDAEKYIELMEKREKLFDRAKKIDEKLAEAAPIFGVDKYAKELETLAKRIVEQDNSIKATALELRDKAKKDVRNINEGKSLSNLYGNNGMSPGGTGRDWTQ
jgi:hypothetical protein